MDTYPEHPFEGRVTAIYPQAEIRDNVVNYVAVVRFEVPRDRVLRPEMTVMARILTSNEGDAHDRAARDRKDIHPAGR